MRDVIRKRQDHNVTLRIGEFGWGSGGCSNYCVGHQGQAQLLTDAFRLFERKRKPWEIEAVNWFSWQDNPTGRCEFCTSSGLFTANRQPKPSWEAFQEAAASAPMIAFFVVAIMLLAPAVASAQGPGGTDEYVEQSPEPAETTRANSRGGPGDRRAADAHPGGGPRRAGAPTATLPSSLAQATGPDGGGDSAEGGTRPRAGRVGIGRRLRPPGRGRQRRGRIR